MVVDDPEGQVAELEYNVVDAKTLDFCHTHVPASQRYFHFPFKLVSYSGSITLFHFII
jgi:hypothetical protein